MHQLRNYDALSGWIKRTVVNSALDHLRKESKLTIVEDTDNINESHTHNINKALSNLSMEELTSIIQQLPDGSRMVFNLYVIEGYSHQEICQKLNLSISASKSRLHEARKALKEKIIQKEIIYNKSGKQIG